jgi:hypothetical protein
MNRFMHFFAISSFTIFMCGFSSASSAHGADPWQDPDHLHLPCVSGTNNDCYSATVPISDLGQFCTYGHPESNVFVAAKIIPGLPLSPLHGLAVYLPNTTTYKKQMKGDPSFGLLPSKPNLPTPTVPDAGCLIGNCLPKFCPCYNATVLATWWAVCYKRTTGGKD